MRTSVLLAPLVALAALTAACVDGTTPDCSKVNCGTPTSDGAVIVDAQADTRAEAGDDAGDASIGDATKPDGTTTDSGVDAKTD